VDHCVARQEVDHCVARQEVDHHELQLRIVVACLEAESRNEKYLQADVSLTHHHHGYQLVNVPHVDQEDLLNNLRVSSYYDCRIHNYPNRHCSENSVEQPNHAACWIEDLSNNLRASSYQGSRTHNYPVHLHC
jgi:hypothetical protein